ncbi:MAG TPA: glycosyltransferase family 1 protein, partial [Gammaproteobacteria bacterium]|nr:glycosyltransferase family 1 protein [Gammaproteobacteria bacterium]
MRIVITTDAWRPQVNGVVTTLSRVGAALEADGHEVMFVTPEGFATVGLPTYPEIRLSLLPGRRVARRLDAFAPDAIHIATEGPLGMAARRYCRRRGLPFTTAYHTQFPRYVRLRAPIPPRLTYAWLRRFHAPAARTMVPTPAMARELAGHGFDHVVVWSRGVDTDVFRPWGKDGLDLPRPVSLFVGRVAVEKNLEAFLDLDAAGTKVVVGDGPDRERLSRRYPEVVFTGYRFGEELARTVAAADVFVFPSRTDTFGLTMLEAMACGVPVAAYPVTGPRDVVIDGVTGCLDDSLGRAVRR